MFNVFAGPTRSCRMIPLELTDSSGCKLNRLHVGHTMGKNTIALALAILELGSWFFLVLRAALSIPNADGTTSLYPPFPSHASGLGPYGTGVVL